MKVNNLAIGSSQYYRVNDPRSFSLSSDPHIIVSRQSARLYYVTYPNRRPLSGRVYRCRFTTMKMAMIAVMIWAVENSSYNFRGKVQIKAVDNPHKRH